MGRIGSSDEHYLAQIYGDLQEMVAETAVLLAIQHLQQCRGRIAAHIIGQFIDFIQYQQRVHGLGTDQRINDTAGHGTNIGLTMAADIRLITHTAQRQSGQLAVHGLGYRQRNGSFSHAGRAYQTKDLALGIGINLTNSNKFQNTLFHFVQAKMIAVQHSFCLFDIGAIARLLVPGHFQAYIEIIADHRCFCAAKRLLCQAVNFLEQLLLYFFGQFQCLYLCRILGNLFITVVAQLMLQNLYLLAQNHVLLDMGNTLAHFALHFDFQGNDIHFVGQDLVNELQAFYRVQLFQNALAVRVAQCNVLCQIVRQMAGIAVIQYGRHQIIRQVWNKRMIFTDNRIRLAQQCLYLIRHAAGEIFL